MNKSEFQKLYQRVQRSYRAVYLKTNSGFVRVEKNADGSETLLEVVGLKEPEVLEDQILALFVWLWSMKDYLKCLCEERGIQSKQIEQIADTERSLSIAADIANRVKHGVLTRSRSGHFARLQNVRISIPLSSVGSISFNRPTVRIDVAVPDYAELFAEIGFDSGDAPVDAFEIATQAIEAWENHAFPLAGVCLGNET